MRNFKYNAELERRRNCTSLFQYAVLVHIKFLEADTYGRYKIYRTKNRT